MANTFSVVDRFTMFSSSGPRKIVTGKLTLDYTADWTSGITITPAALVAIGDATLITTVKGIQVGPPSSDISPLWVAATNKLWLYHNGFKILAEAVTMSGSVTTFTGTLGHVPTQILAVQNSTTQLTVMRQGSTKVTGKVVPNYTTGVLTTYDDTSSAGLTVDYITNALVQANDLAANVTIPLWIYGV